jgi:hypothetical protein
MRFRSTFLLALAVLPGAACVGILDNGCGYWSRAVRAILLLTLGRRHVRPGQG